MKQNFRKHLRPLASCSSGAPSYGCKGVTEEEKTARENGIALLESGDYEGALSQFEAADPGRRPGSQTLRWIS